MKFYVVVVGLFLSLASYGAGAGADTDAGDSHSLNPLVPSATVGHGYSLLEEEDRLRTYLTGGGPRPQGLEMMPGGLTFLCDRNQAPQVQDDIFREHVQDHGRTYVVSRDMPLHAAFESVSAIQRWSLGDLMVSLLGSYETSINKEFLKAAASHLLGKYDVFGTEAVLREWSSNLTSWCEHLAGIISRDYVAFDPQNWDPAGAKGKHVVVDRGVLDNRAHVRTLNRFFREAENQTQSLIVNVLGATTLTMGRQNLPKSVHNLMVTNTDGSVTQIGDNFLLDCSELTVLDLKALSNVTAIGNIFLSGCIGLTAVDFSALSKVTTIGDYFLSGCRGLTAVDLRALSNVTAIGNSFLSGCSGLTALDLSALSNVTAIGNGFLNRCIGLTDVDLSTLSNVTAIGNGFLNRCIGLTDVDLSALSNVTAIGNGFLAGCGLTELDLSALSNVTTIEDSFLDGCSGLKALDLRALSKVTRVGQHFLENCNLLPGHVTYPDGWTHPRPY